MGTNKTNTKLKLSLGECLFYTFWILMSFSKGMGFYEGMAVYNVCLVAAVLCIVAKILLEPHSLLEIIVIVSIFLLCVAVYFSSKDKAPIIYAMLIVGMRNVPVRRIVKTGLTVWGLCFCFKAFSEMTGMVTGMVLVHEKLGLGPIIRWSFGYPHPNVTQITYAVIAAFILYLYKETGKKQFMVISLLFLGNCLVFIYSISYTGFLLTNFYLMMSYYTANRKHFTKFEKTGMLFILPFCAAFSVLGPLLTAEGAVLDQFRIFMDKLLNMRFNAARVYMAYGITLFGNNIGEYDTSFALDCSYVSLLTNDGIILFIVVFISYFLVIVHLLNTDRRKELAITLAFLVAGISEPFLFNTSFKNLIFLFTGEYMYQVIATRKQKTAGHIASRTVWRIHAADRFFTVNWSWIYRIGQLLREVTVSYKKIILMVGIIVGISIGGISGMVTDLPQEIYVAAGNTDVSHKDTYYLDKEMLPDEFDGVIYEYQGKDVPLYRFTGNIVQMEIFRGVICWTILGAAAGMICGLLVLSIHLVRYNRRIT